MKTKWLSYTEINMLEDEGLHSPDLAFSVCVVCYINKVTNFWAVHLLILGGQKHCTYTN